VKNKNKKHYWWHWRRKKEKEKIDIPKNNFWNSVGKEKDFFVDNLAMLVSSGMDFFSALDSIEKTAKSRMMKKIIVFLKFEVSGGSSLWKALEKTNLFSGYVNALIRMGEESGRLEENLAAIAIQQQKERAFRSKIYSAMMYPAFVFFLTIFIGIGISWFILPRLSTVFSQLNIDLPLVTKVLIGIGNFLKVYGYVAVPMFLILAITAFYFTFYFRKTKFIGQFLMLSFPKVRDLIKEVELARFGYNLGLLLEAGLPIIDALDSLCRGSEFYSYRKLYEHIKENIDKGNSFEKSLLSYKKAGKLIPLPVQQMIFASERSGKLTETLKRIGLIYEERTDNTTKNLATVLEPVLLVFVWLGVVSVAMAVILPIYSLVGGLNQNQNNPTPPPAEEIILENPTEIFEEDIIPKEEEKIIQILSTETGFLNVRSEPNKKAKIISKVYPGGIYTFEEEQNNWYLIAIGNGEKGWILGDYVKKEGEDENKEKNANETTIIEKEETVTEE